MLQYENKTMKANLLDLKCRSMNNNIVIMGIKEEENKNYQSTEEKVKVFMKRNLKMMDEQVETIDFQRGQRFGGRAEGRPRPILAMLTHYKMKIARVGN
jgi:hypothetical protein